MSVVTRRAALAGLLGLAAVPVLAACGFAEEEDCVADDLAEQDEDCGYWNESGTFVLYPWVVPGVGGKPPKGKHAKPPAGVKQNPPRRTGGGSGSRTGGGSRSSGGSGTRSGGGRR